MRRCSIPAIFARYPVLASPPTVRPDAATATSPSAASTSRPRRRTASWLRANFTDYEARTAPRRASTRAESYNGVEGLDTEAYVGSWSGQFGSNLLNDLNINYITEDTPREDKGLNLPSFQISRSCSRLT